MPNILGIDLGAQGQYCLLTTGLEILSLGKLPFSEGRLDVQKWEQILLATRAAGVGVVAAEQIFLTRMLTGAVAFAQNVGRVLGEAERQNFVVRLYQPRIWQKDLGFAVGNTKQQSLELARKLFKDYTWKNHNASDAALIAYYAQLQVGVE